MSRAIRWFFVVVAAQAVFLLAWAGYHEWIRSQSDVILVKGRPVDPRDLLRGDYMILNYEISTVPADVAKSAAGALDFKIGEEIWVLLEKRGAYHEIVAVGREEPTTAAGQVLAHATVTYSRTAATTGAMRVDYGIERYFVPEGKGTPGFQKMEVELSVSSAHRLYIRRVLLDGRAYP